MTDWVKKDYSAKTETLADKRQVRVIVSTNDVDRSGEIVEPDGISFKAYMATGAGPVLWNHNANMAVAKCVEISREMNGISALVQFPPEGEDADSDKVYKRVLFGSVPGVSIGFRPVDAVPLDKANPARGPQHYKSCEMMEFSFTPIPCNPNAVVVDKSAKAENWKVGASRNLPFDESSEWDGAAASASIFDACDFDSDSPDTTMARKGFLVYDASAPDLKGSYKLPFAKMVDGKLTAVAAGIRAAASRLPQTDIPEDTATKARAVIDHYEAKMEQKTTAVSVLKAGAEIKIKSLWHVAELARILGNLSWLEECMEWDAMYGDDDAAMPAALGEAMQALGAALVNMTQAEVAALVGEDMGEMDDVNVDETASPMTKAFALHLTKSGVSIPTKIKTLADVRHVMKADTSVMDGTGEAAKADTVKASDNLKSKRMREVEVLRLMQSR